MKTVESKSTTSDYLPSQKASQPFFQNKDSTHEVVRQEALDSAKNGFGQKDISVPFFNPSNRQPAGGNSGRTPTLQRTPAPDTLQTKEDTFTDIVARTTSLDEKLDKAKIAGDWEEVAKILNGYAMFHILAKIGSLSGGQKNLLKVEAGLNQVARISFAVEVALTKALPTDPSKASKEDLAAAVEYLLAINSLDATKLKPEVLSKAKTWAAKSDLDPRVIEELQSKLGAPLSKDYDDWTIAAVFQKQAGNAKNGIADNAFLRSLGIIPYKKSQSAAIEATKLEEVKTLFSAGVTIAVLIDLGKEKDGDKTEFINKAKTFAAATKSLSLNGNTIVLGTPVVVKGFAEAVSSMQSIHKGLAAANKSTDSFTAAPFTKIKSLAIFTHGEPYGMMDNNNNSVDGLINKNVESFVKGIAGATTNDVNFQLFSCNAARGYRPHKIKDTKTGTDKMTDWEDQTWGMPAKENDKFTYEGSFAHKLSGLLGPDANVFAHATAANTTENYNSWVFGKAAGGDGKGAKHVFDVIYDDVFIEKERIRLGETDAAKLRKDMWVHFQDSMSKPTKDPTTGKNIRGGLTEKEAIKWEEKLSEEHKRKAEDHKTPGMDLFYDLDKRKTVIQNHWINTHPAKTPATAPIVVQPKLMPGALLI